MKDFTLKLGQTTYECTSTQWSGDNQSWNIRAKFHDLTLNMSIPIESKVSMDKVMIFITSLDQALKDVQYAKKSELSFINQLT